jgi:hypothetical protein
MATKYRCYLLDTNRIAAVEIVECDDDAAAVLEADRGRDCPPWYRLLGGGVSSDPPCHSAARNGPELLV